jgi:hypothetical protein
LNNQPDFIQAIHTDLLIQTNKYIENNYDDTTETQRERFSLIMNNAIASTDLSFGFWIAGVSMAQGVIAAINGGGE